MAAQHSSRLPPNAVRRHLRDLVTDLSQRQQERLEALVALMDQQRLIRLDQALDVATTPGDDDKRLSLFRQLRAALDGAATEAGIDLHLMVDGSKAPPAQRFCWFEGTDTTIVELTERSRSEAEGAPLDPVEPMVSRPAPLRVYVSHSLTTEPERRAVIDDFIRRVRLALAGSQGRPGCEVTSSGEVHLGDRAVTARRAEADRADAVISLASTGYLVDEDGDLTWIPECDTPVIPVALTAIDPARDWARLHPDLIVGSSKPYDARRTHSDKDAFVREVVVAVRHRLRSDAPLDSPAPNEVLANRSRSAAAWARPGHQLIDGLADPGSLDAWSRAAAGERGRRSRGEPVKAVESLAAWAGERSTASPKLAALLGDLGMGKTTTAQLLTDHLLDQRETGGATAAPLPILFDLRRITVEQYLAAPNLRGVIEAMLTADEVTGHRPSADDVLTTVAAGNCLVIFDGLDEMLVHLTERQGQEFTRTLMQATEAFWRTRRRRDKGKADLGAGQPVSKLLLSCRTHYFRSVAEETGHLTGQDRGGPTAEAWLVLFMLPFNEEQIREYLAANVPGADVDALMALLGEVHDLRGLAERPLSLAMISEQLEFVERAKLAGRPVRPVDLYGAMVDRWLTRDAGKHTLRPDHKQELMEHLAARLWREGRRSWTARQLDQWLVDVMAARPDLRRHYAADISPELWQEDLRTATFLARRGDDEFAFAHSSLLEFFLARYLSTALDLGPDRLDDVVARWAMLAPSAETFDFLGQLLGTDDATARRATATLRAIGTDYHPQASELAFAYALAATSAGHPRQSLRGIRLDGARLRGVSVGATGRRTALSGATLAGADLTEARLTGVDLDGADLRGADLTRARIVDSTLRDADLDAANLTGTTFRGCDLRAKHLDGARPHRTEALLCDLPGTLTSRPGWLLAPNPTAPTAHGLLGAYTGHGGSVSAVAYSPDGSRLASGGDDGVVRVRDAGSGEPVGVRIQMLPGGEIAVFEAATSELVGASADAWQWLGWPTIVDGSLTRLPAETYGPLPALPIPPRAPS